MTKRELVNLIESLPCSDDCVFNVSLCQEDIYRVEQVTPCFYPTEENPTEFCLDFTVV